MYSLRCGGDGGRELAGVGSAEAHAATLIKAGLTKLTAIKTMLHGLSRGIIARIQGGLYVRTL